MQKLHLFVLFVLFYSLSSANQQDTTYFLNFRQTEVPVTVCYPKNQEYRGCVLLLHGFNHAADEWCNRTTFCKKALEAGFVLIYPDFGKTTYQSRFFPETHPKYFEYPTRPWITDTAMVFISEKTGLLKPGGNNFVAGISTGARGACLIALDKPDIFKGAASLSGDFDQTLLPRDAIYNGYYGLYDRFSTRWKTVDNIYNMADSLTVPLYLAHGKLDKVCPVSQTVLFYNHLLDVNPALKTELHIDDTGDHSYDYWETQSDPLLKFFLSLAN